MPRKRSHGRGVFLSHSSRDRRFADRLATTLRAHGVSTWYSKTHIKGAQQWHDEIGAALERCDWFVLILSPSAVKSKWVKRELLFALSDDRYENRIVPLLRRKCDVKALSWTLPAYQAINFSRDFDAGCAELLRVWRVEYRGG